MTKLLLLNIGNSDLLADGQRPRAPRPDGKILWESYEQHQFMLPIVEPCVNYLLKQQARIDTVLIFATDQRETAHTLARDRNGISLRDKDTLWYARIAERYLHEHFADAIGAIQRIELRDINPSMYDEAFDIYGQLLAQYYAPLAESCYVLMAGGIPACNAALQLQAISTYGEHCYTLYQPESAEPYPLRIGEQVLSTFRKATVIDALERQDFAAALPLARRLLQADIAGLIAYACYREAFDFEQANAELLRAITASKGEIRQFLGGLRNDLDPVMAREDMAALLRELLANAAITYRNGRYADFLGRIFRFQEATLRYIVETKLGLPTDMRKERAQVNKPAFAQGIVEQAPLHAFLDARQIDGQPLRYDMPTTPVMQAMLEFILKPNSLRPDGTAYLNKTEYGRYGELKKRLDKLSTLAQLRNQSVIAHGFAGVSRERLAAVYNGDPDQVLQDLSKVVELLQVAGSGSPFDRIAQFAIEQIRQGK